MVFYISYFTTLHFRISYLGIWGRCGREVGVVGGSRSVGVRRLCHLGILLWGWVVGVGEGIKRARVKLAWGAG